MMKQRTAKDVAEVLDWIEHNNHHRAEVEEKAPYGQGNIIAMRLFGEDAMFRIPQAVWQQTKGFVRPGDHHDARMYRATDRGREFLRSLGKEPGYPRPAQKSFTRSEKPSPALACATKD